MFLEHKLVGTRLLLSAISVIIEPKYGLKEHTMNELRPKYADFIPPGEILPSGWLKRQLEIQAAGLSGHLEDFWPDIKDSAWIGGTSEGWERGPYWLDGLVPLAYLLNDKRLIERVSFWIGYTLDHQHSDGWLGPIVDTQYGYQYDPWPVCILLKAYTQYADITGDGKIPTAMARFFTKLHSVLDTAPLKSWGQYRWGDFIISIHWLFEKTGDTSLLSLAQKIHHQRFDWQRHFDEFPFPDKMRGRRDSQGKQGETSLSSHVVNNAMAVKYPALWARQSGDRRDTEASREMIEILEYYHGQATGMFSGDEHLAGRNPSQGTELCAVAEYMYSMEWLLALTGRMEYAERLESIAFNALPATFKPDMWAHQYDQQCNQVICRYSEDNIYTTNGPDSNLYGLDPNYGCCTANMHQAWPKFASSLWLKHNQGPIACSYAPCTVNTAFREAKVNIEVESKYPFHDSLRIKVQTDRETSMKLRLRQPKWCRALTITCSDDSYRREREGFCYVTEADWHRGITLDIELPMKSYWESRYNGSHTLKRGPLVYALGIDEDWSESERTKPHNTPPHGEWEVYPLSPWNVALKHQNAGELKVTPHEIDDTPFSRKRPPISVNTSAKLVPGWTIEKNAAAPPPASPLNGEDLAEDETTVELIPYGCTNLRIAEFPWFRAPRE